MKQSYFAKYGRQLTCLLGLLGLAAPRAQAQTATSIYYTQGSSSAALDAVKSIAATGAGGATTLPAGATTLAQPTDIVVDRAGGYLYVADQYVGTGAIWRYNLDGTGQTRVVAATAGATYNGLALDAANGRLYFTQAGSTASQAALKVVSLGGTLPATATTVTTLPTAFTRPGDLALDAAAGVLYVADQRTAGSIIRVVISSGAVTTLVNGVANANYNGLALDAANGRLYFTQGSADATLDALKLVTLSTSAVTTLASGSTNFTQPTDLAFEPGPGQLYLTDQYVSTGPLLRYTVGVSNGAVSVSNRTALVSATTGAAYGGLALALGTSAPVVATSTGAVTAPEQVATAVDPGLTVTDTDSPTLTSATVSISSGLVSAEDALLFFASSATSGNIAGSYNAGTGVLTLSSAGGTATLAQWQAALRSVAYRNSSDAPTTAARTISFVVSDGSQNSNAATRTLNVQAVNDAPVITDPASISTAYNTDVVFTGANAITVSDVDAGSGTISTTLTPANGNLVYQGTPRTGPITVSSSVAGTNSFLPQIFFRPTPGFSGTATLTVLTNDQGNTGTGGALTATSTINIVVAAPALTATLSTTSANPTSTAPIPFAVTFSQSVGNTFTASDVTVSNGFITSGSFSGSGAGPYTFTVTPFGSNTVTVGVVAGVAADANGTANTASNTVGVQYNQPVTNTPTLNNPANGSFVRTSRPEYRGTATAGSLINIYRATGGGGFVLTDTTFANSLGNYHKFAALADGQYAVYVTATASGRATSANSNTNTFTVDATPPTVVLSSSTVASGGTTSTSPVSFTASFSEPVTGFTSTSFLISGGTLTSGPTAGSGNTYTFQVTPSRLGSVVVQVLPGTAQDRAGNSLASSAAYSFTFAAPTITVAPASLPSGQQGTAYSQALTASGGTAPYTYAITSGALPAGLILSNGTITGTPAANGTFNFTVTATDASVSPGPYRGSRSYSLFINTQPVTAAPIVTTPANGSFSNNRTVTVAGTAPAGSTVSIYINGSFVNTTPASAAGTFSYVVPGSAPDGTYTASATAQSSGATTSVSSNVNTFTIDGTAPTVALSSATVASGGTTSTSPVSFTATFSESVMGFTAAGLTVSNGTVTSGPTAGANNTYTFQVTPGTVGTVTVRVAANAAQDQAANGNTASGAYTFLFAAPTITVAPASVAPGTQGQPYSQTFSASGGSGSYSYFLSGSIPSGLRFSGSTLSGTPTTSGSFTFRITATDNSAAPGPYSGFTNYTLLIAPPAVTVAPVLTSPANSSTTSGTPTYAGTAPAGSTVTVYVAAGSGAYQLVGTTTATSGGSFSLVSPTALASGTYSAYATAQSSGNTVSANSNTNTFLVDATAPVVVASNRQSPVAAATNATTLTFRVTFSESVTGVDASDFALTTTAGTVSSSGRTVVAISGSVYDVTVSGVTGNGTVRLDLNASGTGIVDAVGNAISGGYTSGQTYTLDQTAPTATISTAAGSPTSTSPIPFTVTFSEPVTGFSASSITVTNGTVSSALTTNGNAYSFSVTPAASGVVVTVSVAANAAQDAVGNGNLAAAPLSVTYIATPTITSLSPATGPVGTQVTIMGTNLSNASAVRFNGTPASSFVVNSASSITAVVAAGTTTGRVTVTTPGGTATSPYDFVVRVAPTTVADSYTTPQNVTLTGNVLTNDIGTNPRAILINRPANGTLALNPDGSFTYVPNPGFTGTDSFTYYACDPNLPLLCGNPATVTISVVRVAPITVADSYTVPAGATLTGNVLTNDIGTNPRAILITRPANGTLVLNPNGSFSYVPNPGFTGTDSFTYYACDPNLPLLCGNPATVTITVTGGGPITVADAYSTPMNTLLTGNVLTNDIGTSLRAILINRPMQGTLVLNPDGSFSYQPTASYVGPDSFTYYACNMGAPLVCGSPATVSITVLPAGANTRTAATIGSTAATSAKPAVSAAGGATISLQLALAGHPNPFGDELQLSYTLPIDQAYTLAVYDAQGRLVQQLARGQADAGQEQQLVVPTHDYAAGLYLVRLTTATGTRQLKLIKQ